MSFVWLRVYTSKTKKSINLLWLCNLSDKGSLWYEKITNVYRLLLIQDVLNVIKDKLSVRII